MPRGKETFHLRQHSCFPEARVIRTLLLRMQQRCPGEDNARPGTSGSHIMYSISPCSSSICKSIKTNSFLDVSFSILSRITISGFKDFQSTIQESQQHIQESRNIYEQSARLVSSISWEDETEAREISKILRHSGLLIQERELRVQQMSLQLEEKTSTLISLEINSIKAMRFLATCLREAITASSDRVAGP